MPKVPVKTLLTGLLSTLAVTRFLLQPELPRLFCAAAMLLSSLGDFALMSTTPLGARQKESRMVRGAALFAAAHVFYMASALSAAYRQDAFCWKSGAATALVLMAAGSISMGIASWGGHPSFASLAGGLLYLSLLSLNAGVVFAYGLAAGGVRLLAMVGALCFFLSDYLIGWRTFGNARGLQTRRGNRAIWFLYVTGQCLLILFLV